MGKKKKKKIKKIERRFSNLNLYIILCSIFQAALISIITIPLLYTGGKLQPYLNFFIAGFFFYTVSRNHLTALIKFFSFGIFAFLIWPGVFNQVFFERFVAINDPLLYGDMIIQAVFGELLFNSANLNVFQIQTKLLLFSLCFISGFLGYLLSVGFKKINEAFSKHHKNLILNSSFLFGLIIILTLSVYSFLFPYASFRARIDKPTMPGSYATDYHIYKRTYEILRDNRISFYQALHQARNEDVRVIKEPDKAYAIPSAHWVRLPYLFYLWAFLGSFSPQLIIIFALALFILGYSLVSYAFEKNFFYGSSILYLIIIQPFFYLALGWESLFAPEVWGSLFALISTGLLLNGKLKTSLIFAQLAALSRNLFVVFYAAVFIYVTIRFIATKKKRDLALTIPLGTIFPIAYTLHILNVIQKHRYILTVQNPNVSLGVSFGLDINQALRNLTYMSNFLTFPYTLHIFYGVVFFVAFILLAILRVLSLRIELKPQDII
ncbi:MAG: hypothetical protein N2440_06550, partial [Actinobacteria bacterium]|nr:hypothetical protein [Actinomycetota bacterium]